MLKECDIQRIKNGENAGFEFSKLILLVIIRKKKRNRQGKKKRIAK
jgi:hypothetical protein